MLAAYSYLFLLIIGSGVIWLGLKIRDEVYRIAIILSGVLLGVMGFAAAPSIVQIGVILLIWALYKLYAPQPQR